MQPHFDDDLGPCRPLVGQPDLIDAAISIDRWMRRKILQKSFRPAGVEIVRQLDGGPTRPNVKDSRGFLRCGPTGRGAQVKG